MVIWPQNATWQLSNLNAKTLAKDLGIARLSPCAARSGLQKWLSCANISSIDQSRSGRLQMLTAWSTKINFTMEWPLQSCGAADQCPCACLQRIVTAAAPAGPEVKSTGE